MWGNPFFRIPMSDVVPPMSMTTASSTPVSDLAPIRLDAGPERMVSTGFFRAVESFIRAPSPFTIISGDLIPNSFMMAFTDLSSSSMTGMRRAFITAVVVRCSNPSLEVRSWAHTTGTFRMDLAILSTRFSWDGLRTLTYPETATASTLPFMASSSERTVLTSRGFSSFPDMLNRPSTTA